ncbi:UNVERIFIED_CONTAM: Retrovirus-related Pol polyprotein from transposon RE2 [Sesamum calycinum]|uniref:Retrovirus-related Pol polyprotein from transposon RE2 n=1 Tax=Sesamum calycinum TaxID=2727403 RepID=A0AAW2QKI4_9LAMI
MILRVKRQRQVHLDITVRHDGAVMHAVNFEKRKEEQKEVTKDNTISISDMVMELVRVLKQIPHDPIQVNHTGEYADGSTKQVTQSGFVNFFGKTKLVDTLYVPSFRSNLISIHKTCATSNIRFTFLSSHCILQDNLTKTIVAVAKHSRHLYILDKDSFSPAFINQFLSSHFSFVSQVVGSDLSLWHQKLGHPSHKFTTYVDADWGACVDSHCSMTSYCVFLGSSLISWKTKKQNIELKSYTQAQGHLEWERAMAERLKVLEANNTWEVTFSQPTAPDGFLALLVYIDDILVMGPSKSLIMEVKSYLDALFTIKDLGYVKYFLGLEVARSPDGMSITQHKYVVDIILDTGMTTASSVLTPLPTGIKLTSKSGAMLREPNKYRKLIGRLLYLGFTRPDISFAVKQLSQYLQRPTEQHWHAALHVVHYLKGTPTTCLFFPSLNTFQLTTYVDADWGVCVDSRRSVTSYYVFLGSSLISWKTKKQNIVSRSSAEAALHKTANPVFHERTKHLDIDCHVVREKYKDGFISPSFISSKLQLADIFTKSLSGPSFQSVLSELGLLSVSPIPA